MTRLGDAGCRDTTRAKLLPVLPVLPVLVALAAPGSASAAERFAGVTESGAPVSFTSRDPYAPSAPRVPRGLLSGERIVALSDGPAGLLAIGSSARLYAVDAAFAEARPVGPPFPQGLRGVRFSLAVAPALREAP